MKFPSEQLLLYALDRFGRNVIQTAINENTLNKNGVVLLSATEGFKDDPAGRMYRNISMAFAQYYSDELSQKITRGMDINGEKCLCTGGGVALGFKVDEHKHFQIDEKTAPVVREIFNMYANGKTVAEIINLLNERHISTSRGNEFNKNSLHRMLRNKRYIGTYTYKGKETPEAIPRIIDDETFNTVQEILDKNKKAPARARAKTEYLLTTKLFCGHCKDMMTGVSGKSHTTAKHHYYICNNRKKKLCDKKTVRKDFIEGLVIIECRKLLTAKNINRIAKEVSAISEKEGESFLLQQMQKQFADNEKKKKNLVAAVTECEIESVRKSLYEQLAIIEQTLLDLEFQIAKERAGQVRLTAPEIRFFLNALKNGDPDTAKHKKTLIAIFVNAIYLYDDKITLVFNSGDKPVTITNSLLSDIEKQAEAVPVGERFVYDTNASTKNR